MIAWQRVSVPLVTAGLLILATALLPRFAIEPDLARMLPDDHLHVQLTQLLESRAANRRSLFVILRGAIDETGLAALERDLRTSPFLTAVELRREELLGPERERQLRAPTWFLSAPELDRLAARLSGPDRQTGLEETLRTLAEDPLGGREVARRDPLGLRWLLDHGDTTDALPIEFARDTPYAILAGGDRAILRLTGKHGAMDAAFAQRLLEDVEARLAASGWGFDLLGGHVVARADAERLTSDLRISVLTSILLVFVYLLYCLRSARYAWTVFVPVALAAYCAIAIGGAWFGPLSPLAIAAAAVLLGLGVDFAIHYLAIYLARRQEEDHLAAAAHARQRLGAPLFVGMATTAGAFLSLASGEFRGLAGFGMLLALGLFLAFLATLFVLPLLLGRLQHAQIEPTKSWIAERLEHLATGPYGRAWALAITACALVGCCAIAVRGVDLSVDPGTLRPADDPVARTAQRLEKELGMSLTPLLVLLPETSIDRIGPRQVGRALRDAGLARVFVPLGRDVERQRRLVRDFRAATQGFVNATLAEMAELGFAPEPFRPGLEELAARLAADPDPLPAAEWVTNDGHRFLPCLCYPVPGVQSPAKWQEFERQVRELAGEEARTYGSPTLLAELRSVLRHDLLQAGWWTAGLALFLVLLMTRSILAALIAILPAAFGLGVALGTLALIDVPLTLGNFVAIPFLLGIGIDDGVHLVARFRGEEGIAHGTVPTTGATGVAVVRTSLTTTLAFGSLLTAASPGPASMGWIVALGVGTGLLASLLVLPRLAAALRLRV